MFTMALGFLKPYLLKIGIAAAILAACLGAWLYVTRLQSELHAAQNAALLAPLKCANTQLSAAASVNATTQADVNGQRISLDTAQAGLQSATTASQVAGAGITATVAAQAAQPGYDGPVPMVLVNAVNGLEAVQ